MIVIFLLIPLSVVIATAFLFAFIWAVRSGQYEDTCTPSLRLLMPDGVAHARNIAGGKAGQGRLDESGNGAALRQAKPQTPNDVAPKESL